MPGDPIVLRGVPWHRVCSMPRLVSGHGRAGARHLLREENLVAKALTPTPLQGGASALVFRNERTWQTAVEAGRQEEFHAAYDAAVAKVRAEFGRKQPIYIDGKAVWSKGGTFDDTSPADRTLVLGQFQKGTRADARKAVAAAKAGFPGWSATPYLERARTMQRAADLMSGRKFYLAALMTFENGKNRFEAVADVDEAIDFLRWYAEALIAIQYVTGPGSTVGQELVENEDVAGFAFTGSRAVGLGAFRRFSETHPKPMIAEMGGKNPAIVTATADLEKAVAGVMRAAFGYGGQKCSATSRVIVDKRIKRQFLSRLVEETKRIRIGDPTQRDVFLGPVINEDAVGKFRLAVQVAKRARGTGLCGGNVLAAGAYKKGLFVEPTIVDGLPPGPRINQEEWFVPVLGVIECDGLEEALEIANGVEYGLTAGVFFVGPGGLPPV